MGSRAGNALGIPPWIRHKLGTQKKTLEDEKRYCLFSVRLFLEMIKNTSKQFALLLL